ncbi:phospholipase D family protein [Lysobacter sp. S4-A87]|uniref:phospholipase D family protein n=1 Tax=Lysobacter sp. S4-A87 TaxID=2925843 RepID=UPI001F53CC6A|nr:phospholipase D family protein [Lysobacter sp. S4-A87]UNK48704.1 phospholipase D family protein [Lysobacter sp. S4-A87]
MSHWTREETMRRLFGWSAIALLVLLAAVGGALLLTNHLAPPATGRPGHALPLQPAQTAIDRELAPLLAANPGKTGAIFLTDGVDAFAARAISARKAGRSLDLQYFIWHNDLTGRLLASEAYDAAQRGVRVRILLDDMNAAGLDPHLLAMDAHPGIELRLYNPFRNRQGTGRAFELARRSFSMTHRMHNKAWIADGRIAIIGGRNIGEQYFSADSEVNFRDLDLLLLGPAVQQASTIFDRYWNSSAAVPITTLDTKDPQALRTLLREVYRDARSTGARRYLDRVARSQLVRDYYGRALQPHWSAGIEVVADPPVKWSDDNRAQWLIGRLGPTISAARKKVLVISPYFVPGEDGAARLAALTRRGAYVGVVTNSLAATDVYPVHSGYAQYRERLIREGADLHELRAHPRDQPSPGLIRPGASLHTKAFVLDDARGFVGSFNVDPRSKNLNTEMGVLFDDPVMARQLRDEYLRLTAPAMSYWVYRDRAGELRWLDRAQASPVALDREPDAGFWSRALAWASGWLPIESQL